MRWAHFLAFAGWLTMIGTSSFAAVIPQTDSVESNREASEVVVQIFGRMCEYHREDVEGSLRACNTVRQVEFLNDQGTVLVRYQLGGETPELFAGAIHRALAAGWNCSASVDRDEQRPMAMQQQGRP